MLWHLHAMLLHVVASDVDCILDGWLPQVYAHLICVHEQS